MIDESDMSGRPVLDEESFTKLLAAAYVMQEHHEQVRAKVPASDFTHVISQTVETRHTIQTRRLDLDAALDLIAVRLQKLSGAAGAAIGLLEQGELHYKAGSGVALVLVGSHIGTATSFSAECLATGKDVRSPIAENDARFDPVLCRRVSAKSLVAVPVYHEGRIAGSVELFFTELGAFDESDARVCELMAGLVTEVLTERAEREIKQELAAERAGVLLALEKLKPQLEKLASEPAVVSESTPERTTGTELCRACGNAFLGDESYCGVCGASRTSGKYPGAELQGKWATLWERWQLMERKEGVERAPTFRNPGSGESVASAQTDQAVPYRILHAERHNRPEDELTAVSNESTVSDLEVSPNSHEKLEITLSEPDPDSDFVKTGLASGEESPQALVWAGSPWISAIGAREWLKSEIEENSWGARLKNIWWAHGGDISLVLAGLVVGLALLWGLWPSEDAAMASSQGGYTIAQGHRLKRNQPQLTVFEKLLVSLGLAEPPPASAYMGDPKVNVWVDLHTALYYCPSSELYGKTSKGKYTTQADAQQDQFEPAYRRPCD